MRILLIACLASALVGCSPVCVYEPVKMNREAAQALVKLDRAAAETIAANNASNGPR